MSISLVCSKCGTKLKAPERAVGRRTQCPKCGAPLVVPVAPADPPPSPKEEVLDVIPVDPQPTKTIQTKCPFCNAPWAFERRFAGTQITCSKCSHLFRIPQQSTDEAERFIVHQCPMCKKRLHIPYAERGRTVPCVGCKRPIQYPSDAVPQIRSTCPKCKAALWLPHNHGDDPVLCPSCNTTHRLAGLPAKDSKGFLARMSEWAEKQSRDHPVIYLGGPFDLKAKSDGILTLDDNEVIFKSSILRREFFRIRYSAITGAHVDTAERLGKLRTLGALALAGPLAAVFVGFGIKKKEKLLKLDFKDESGMEVTIIFGKASFGPDMDSLSGKILSRRRESVTKSDLPGPKAWSCPDGAPAESPIQADVTTLLEKLASLREKGILTEEEFQMKKAELLSRM